MTAIQLDHETAKLVDSYLLQAHRNDFSNAKHLRELANLYDMDDETLQARLKAALKAKADYAKSKQPRKFKASEGVIVADIDASAIVDRLLTYPKPGESPSDSCIDDLLADGHIQVPPAHLDRRHRDDEQSAEEFGYLMGLLRSLHNGNIKRGKVAYCFADNAEARAAGLMRLPVFIADLLPMSFDPSRWVFIRARGQSQAKLDKARELVGDAVDDEQRRDAMKQRQQPAKFGGKRF